MTAITINIPDDQFQILQELAHESNISAEDLLRINIENWLTPSQNEFAETADYVLKKNAELYRRLA